MATYPIEAQLRCNLSSRTKEPQGDPRREPRFPLNTRHHREALEVARYVTDMTAQLEAMAVAARLDLLAYFLNMVKAEGDMFVRSNAEADGSRVEPGEGKAAQEVREVAQPR
jgi:hypothetical protein